MAISVYYELSAPESFAESDIVRVLEAARKHAIAQHFGVVSALNRQIGGAHLDFCIENPFQTGAVLKVLPTSGFWFRIQLAYSTDSALVGLCRFPHSVRIAGREVPSGVGEGWHFQSSCRTQNPTQREFQTFFKRHVGLIVLLRAIQTLGIETEVEDDGDYWKMSDASILEGKFKSELESVPLLDAAFAGALDGRAPERSPTLFGTALRGQFFAQFAKRAK